MKSRESLESSGTVLAAGASPEPAGVNPELSCTLPVYSAGTRIPCKTKLAARTTHESPEPASESPESPLVQCQNPSSSKKIQVQNLQIRVWNLQV